MAAFAGRMLAVTCRRGFTAPVRCSRTPSRSLVTSFSRDFAAPHSHVADAAAPSGDAPRSWTAPSVRHIHLSPWAHRASRPFSAAAALPDHTELPMPSLSPTMTQGNVATWHKKEGDRVAAGDVLCEIETDKATLEMEAQEDGYLARILVPAGSKNVKVGVPIAILVEDSANVSAFRLYSSSPGEGVRAPTPIPLPPTNPHQHPHAPVPAASPPPAGPLLNFPEHTRLDMPSLSPTMTQGNLAKWRVQAGDAVAAGDVLCEVETDKATLEVEAQDAGVIAKLLVPGGARDIPVGTPICIIAEDAASVAAFKDYVVGGVGPHAGPVDPQAHAHAPSSGGAHHPLAPPGGPLRHGAATAHPGKLGPAVRLHLHASGLSVRDVPATGPRGVLTKGDVLAAVDARGASSGSGAARPPASPSAPSSAMTGGPAPSMSSSVGSAGKEREAAGKGGPVGAAGAAKGAVDGKGEAKSSGGGASSGAGAAYSDVPTTNIRKIIGGRLLDSKTGIPHMSASAVARLDAVLALRAQLKSQQGVAISVNDFVVKAVAGALARVPQANGYWDESTGAVGVNPTVDVSVAVATDTGLITPIVRSADKKSLSVISTEVKALAERARQNKLKPHEFQGGTATISNLGMYGLDEFSAIINPPQACILAVGAGVKRVVPREGPDGRVVPETVTEVTVTVSADQRVFDGETTGKFLAAVKGALEDPVQMLV